MRRVLRARWDRGAIAGDRLVAGGRLLPRRSGNHERVVPRAGEDFAGLLEEHGPPTTSGARAARQRRRPGPIVATGEGTGPEGGLRAVPRPDRADQAGMAEQDGTPPGQEEEPAEAPAERPA